MAYAIEQDAPRDGHRCAVEDSGTARVQRWGAAIDECVEASDGSFWVFNDEYATRVNFCPFCGESAKSKRDDYAQHAPTQPGLGGPCCDDPCVVRHLGGTYCANCEEEPS